MPTVRATTARNRPVVRNWWPSMSALPGGVVVVRQLLGQRVEVGVGVAAVEERDEERRHELQQAEDQRDVDVAHDLRGHEAAGEHRQQYVEAVPGQERGGGRDDEAAVARTELTELGARGE